MMSNEWSLSSNIQQQLHSTSVDGYDGSFKSSDPRMRIPLRSMSDLQQRNNNSLSTDGSASSLSTLMEYEAKRSHLTEESLENTLRILNDELNLLGFPSVFNLWNSTLHLDVASLASAAHDVVRLYQQSLRQRENLELQLKRAEADLEHHQRVQKRLHSNIEESDKLIRLCQEKERQLNNKVKSLTSAHKSDKDEIRRLKADLGHSQSQYRHERNKLERESAALRDRLHSAMSNPRAGTASHMDLLNCLQRLDGKRRTWARPKGDGLLGEKSKDDLHQFTLRQMEARQEEMLVENKDLRRCLFRTQRRLDALLTGEAGAGALEEEESGEAAADVEMESRLEGGLLGLPYDLMRENVERSLQEKVEQVRALIAEKAERKKEEELPPAKSPRRQSVDFLNARYREEMEALKRQILQYENVIEDQEKMLKRSLMNSLRKPSADLTNDFKKDTEVLESQHRLAEERRAFYEQKAEFEREKTNFSEAAMSLCRERVPFLAVGNQRKTLDDEKANFLRQQLLLLTPGSRVRLPGGEARRNSIATTGLTLTPSKSSFTPAPPGVRTDADIPSFSGFSREDIPPTISESKTDPNVSLPKSQSSG